MSNGGVGGGGSRAPYIIICQGRIDVLNSQSDGDKIAAASRAAASLVSFYGDKVTGEQGRRISELQHSMMDNFNLWNKSEVSTAVNSMFVLLDDLEDEMEGK